MDIHHIGYLVKNMEDSLYMFRELGYIPLHGKIFYDSERDADICFVCQKEYCVELIAPRRASGLYSLLKRYKNTAYHICYRVFSLSDAIKDLEYRGFKMFIEPQVAPAISDKAEVVFLMHPDMGIVELLQE